MTTAIQLSAYTAVSAIGNGLEAMAQALTEEKTGLTPCDFEDCQLSTYIGRIKDVEAVTMPERLQDAHSRNNQIALLGLQQERFSDQVINAVAQYGTDRVGIIVGTSTSGFLEFEHAYQQKAKTGQLPDDFPFTEVTDFYATTQFIANYFSITGPTLTINTACSSSAKAFISAARMLQTKLCDAVIVAGVDSLCLNTLYGFASLELLATDLCRPCDKERQGLNIGEAGAFILLERSHDQDKIHLLGYGESADAHHMSSPHPEGLGAQLAMQQALDKSQLSINDIDYINMHGTATPINDRMEDRAIHSLFANKVPCSSTKGWTGHTLGAAGALEAVLSCMIMEMNLIPGCLNSQAIDPSFNSKIQLNNTSAKIHRILSNSFGFGGNNCSLIFGRQDGI